MVRDLEDFAVGEKFGCGRLVPDRKRIKSYAAEFDRHVLNSSEATGRSTFVCGSTVFVSVLLGDIA
jgi:hypothetical protein